MYDDHVLQVTNCCLLGQHYYMYTDLCLDTSLVSIHVHCAFLEIQLFSCFYVGLVHGFYNFLKYMNQEQLYLENHATYKNLTCTITLVKNCTFQ